MDIKTSSPQQIQDLTTSDLIGTRRKIEPWISCRRTRKKKHSGAGPQAGKQVTLDPFQYQLFPFTGDKCQKKSVTMHLTAALRLASDLTLKEIQESEQAQNVSRPGLRDIKDISGIKPGAYIRRAVGYIQAILQKTVDMNDIMKIATSHHTGKEASKLLLKKHENKKTNARI